MDKVRTRREESRHARRAAIVAIARGTFLEQGYAATSMSTIAGILGGSKGTLWAYFASKEALFAAVLDDLTASFREELEDALRPGRDQRTTLLRFAERFIIKILAPQSLRLQRLVVGEGGRFPEIGPLFSERGPQVVLDRLARYIGEQMDRGELRRDDPAAAAAAMVSLALVPQQRRLWNNPEMDEGALSDYADHIVDLFLRAYRPD